MTGAPGAAALERATGEDVERLLRLGAGPPGPSSRQALLREQRAGRLLVLRSCGGVVAWASVRVVADELHVEDLGVAARDRRRGWGRRLLRLLLDLGRRRGVVTVWLEVRRGNAPARSLYRAAGFEEVSVRRGYYAGCREDAVVMRRRLTPAAHS